MKYPDTTGHIYGLYDPEDEVIRYVGRTKQPLFIRLRQHIDQSRRRKYGTFKFTNPRVEWIRTLLDQGRKPHIKLLESVPIEFQRETEDQWMQQMPDLVNSGSANQGGTRSYVAEWTPEREALLGKVADSILAEEMGITRKAVTYKRQCLGIEASYDLSRMKPPPAMGGHNKITLPENIIELLGKMSDRTLGQYIGVSKYKIQRERQSRGIPSYAETTGNNGQYKDGHFPTRWLPKQNLQQLNLALDAVLPQKTP
jgi:hypothetical protein